MRRLHPHVDATDRRVGPGMHRRQTGRPMTTPSTASMASSRPHEVLDRLLGERERRAPAELGHVDPSRVQPVEQLGCRLGIDPTEVEAVRQHDEVGGETVASDVRALPHPPCPLRLAQRPNQRPPEIGAALVVPPVGAHEQLSLGHGFPFGAGWPIAHRASSTAADDIGE